MINERKAGVILSYLTMAINVISGIIYVPFLLSTIGQEEYGLYQLLGGMAAYASIFDLGLSNTVTRFYIQYKQLGDRKQLENLLSISRMIFWGLNLICLGVFLVIYFNLQNVFPKLETSQLADGKIIFLLLIVSICSTIPTYVYQAVSTAEEKFVFIRGLTLLAAVMQPICVILLVLKHPSAITVTAVHTVLNVVLAIIRILYVKLRIRVKFKFHGWDKLLVKSLFSFSVFVFLNSIADQINWELGKTLVGILQGETAAVAVLSIGIQLAKYYMMFSSNVSSVFFPAVQKSVTADPSMSQTNALFIKVSRIQALILGLILSGFAVFGQEFIDIWSGPDNAGAYYIALGLMAVLFIPLSQNIGISVLQAQNNHRYRSVVYLALSALNLAISIPAIYRFGEYGAALGSTIAFFVGNDILMCIVYKVKGRLAIGGYFKFTVKFVLIVALLAVPSYFINKLILVDGYTLLIVKILVYCILYSFLIWFAIMNNYEKSLITSIFKKIKHMLRHDKSPLPAASSKNDEMLPCRNFDEGFVKIVNKTQCCGCEACVNACPMNCIDMIEDEEGFRYPHVDSTKCVKCGACKHACPYSHSLERNSSALSAYACYNTELNERLSSASGGIFLPLAKEIVSRGGVVYGAAFNPQQGAVCKRACAIVECSQFQGSKYIQSHNNECYSLVKSDLRAGLTVLYTGTPCQINGLNSYLHDTNTTNLYCVDIVCHGVPSNLIYIGYLDYLQKKFKKPVKYINFRDKSTGWASYSVKITFDDGDVTTIKASEDYFIKAFLSNALLRPSCLHCPANDNRNKADISIGDYWGCERNFADMNDHKGLSAVIVRTEKGSLLFDSIKPNLICRDASIEDIVMGNPNLVRSSAQTYNRRVFISDLRVRDFDVAVEVTTHIPFTKRVYRKLKTLLASFQKRH